jgi:hypothetical protein
VTSAVEATEGLGLSYSTSMRRTLLARHLRMPLLACALAVALSGCGSMVADLPVVGLPDGTPARKEQGAFLPVHDIPGPRDQAKMETAEQAKVRAELAAARAQQAAAAAAATK